MLRLTASCRERVSKGHRHGDRGIASRDRCGQCGDRAIRLGSRGMSRCLGIPGAAGHREPGSRRIYRRDSKYFGVHGQIGGCCTRQRGGYSNKIGRASCREKSVDLGGRRIIKKKKKKKKKRRKKKVERTKKKKKKTNKKKKI